MIEMKIKSCESYISLTFNQDNKADWFDSLVSAFFKPSIVTTLTALFNNIEENLESKVENA
jgi:hypothetical protein